MEAEYTQINPVQLCTRRRKREHEEEGGGLALLLSMDLDVPESRPPQQAPPQVPYKLKAVAQELGHEIRIFSSTTFESVTRNLPKPDQEEDDDFYELQPADYYKLFSNRLAEQSKVLKTRKIREAELAAQRARITKAVMRVRFPDGYILEAEFHPSATVHNLVDLLTKVIARPDLPFYLYTVPPKKRILDTSQDFYTIGFVPGANVFFSYDLPVGSELNDGVKSGPYLREEILALDGLSLLSEPSDQPDVSKTNSDSAHQSYAPRSDSAPPPNKKSATPKWFKRSSPQLVALRLVPMGKKKNKPERPIKLLKDVEQAFTSDYFGGDSLDELLSKLIRSVEVAKASSGGLPEKIWMKEQFCIGVNDVTRVLERMPAAVASHSDCSSESSTRKAFRRAPLVPLQAVLIAADCNPKWLTKHIPTLASTKQVPVLCLKDNKGSSLRLGQVANVRTALAIGIKARGSIINKTIDEVLKGRKPVADDNESVPILSLSSTLDILCCQSANTHEE